MALLEDLMRNAWNSKNVNIDLGTLSGWIRASTGSDIDQYESAIVPSLPSIKDATVTGAELFKFLNFWKKNFTVFMPERNFGSEFEGKLVGSTVALLYSKTAFQKEFGSGFFAQQIRPVTVYAPGGTVVENWIKTSVTAGWNSGVFTLNLGYNSSTAVLNLHDYVTMYIFGIADFDPSAKVIEYMFYTPTEKYGVKQIYQSYFSNAISVGLLEQDVLAQKNAVNLSFDLNYATSGTSIPALIGVQFVTKDYYVLE
ncbi:MAG: hypothetical protein ACP5MB_06080 [bacterium]